MGLLNKVLKYFLKFESLITNDFSCMCCGREIVNDKNFKLCDDCFSKLEFLENNLCIKCGEMLPNESVKVCDHCKTSSYSFDSNHSVVYYSDVASTIIKNFKYSGRKYYAEHIAKFLFKDKSVFEEVDIITFVPISKKRMKERGFNQAEELAKIISEETGIPLMSLLEKVNDGKHQAGLNQKSRYENLKNSFTINSNLSHEIKGKSIMILDDVFTTGSTLSECAKTLKSCKPKMIKTLTFAKTKFNSLKS